MPTVTIHQAKTHLSKLIQKALAGEEIIIAKGKQPLVRLVVLPEACPQRRIGGAKGMVTFMADDFDAPLKDFQMSKSGAMKSRLYGEEGAKAA